MEIEYIKANDKYYYPQLAGIQDSKKHIGYCYDVCFIKKLIFGIFQIDFYDPYLVKGGYGRETNQKPNARLLIYPSGIQEIKYKLNT